MKGLGTDEKSIINVIGHRNNKQRQDIIVAYKQAYGKDLIKDLKSELSGNFESLVKAMFMKPRHYDVYCLERAMSGIGTNEAALIEILTTRTNAEIREIKEIFKKEKKKDLEKALKSETSGHFSRMLVSLCNASRNETTSVDAGKARADAQALYQAGEKKWGTDESTFNMIMCSRSIPQLRATFIEYHKIANRDLAKSIEGEFSGDIEDGLKAIVETARNAPAYFAKKLHGSMAGAGTDDHTLIRIVVSRSEVDMVEIKQEFQRAYSKSLGNLIQGDTSGDYKHLLMALVGS